MASSSAPPGHADPQSFTTMDKDLDVIGAHCQYTFCNQLDFLPFRCESCKQTFCLDHRSETAHKCARAGEWAAASKTNGSATVTTTTTSGNTAGKPTLQTATQCSHPVCKSYINTLNSVGVGCLTCNRQYCLKHRLQEDHSCATLIPLGSRPTTQGPTQADKARAALGRLRLWGKEKQAAVLPRPKPSTTSAAARISALNTLKRTAKGDVKIPPEKRVYLYIEAEAAATDDATDRQPAAITTPSIGPKKTQKTPPKGEFWYGKEWRVGRVLDAAAKNLQVVNVNNSGKGEAERLRVFHVELGRLLEFSEMVGDSCVDGNTLVLLRGVGPGPGPGPTAAAAS